MSVLLCVCMHIYIYIYIYICWVTKVTYVKSDAVQKVCEWVLNGHDDVEFHRRRALRLCRTMLHIFEVGFAQELNLYIYIYIYIYICKTLF